MFSKPISLEKLLNFIPAESKPVIFNDSRLGGWGQWAAWDPIDEISLFDGEDFSSLFKFINKYAGKFLAGYISFETGEKIMELKRPEEPESTVKAASRPAVHFRAFSDLQALSLKPDKNYNRTELPKFKPQLKRSEYGKNFKQIKRFIRQGEIYQVNYTHELIAESQLNPRVLFREFSRKNPVAFSAYFEDSCWAIHSFSPERFIRIKGNVIRTEPIKGTRPRGKNRSSDRNYLNKLLESEKERAELNMIIDLMRNDLGKICRTGSVEVLESRSIRKLARVMHTYGIVEGRLKPGIRPAEALLSLLPGGSISGCPKKRALEIILDLEDYQRGIYTGNMGYILPDGTLDFNIAIRTIFQSGEKLTLGVGGGITIDSIEQEEYAETMAKADSFKP
ncbi:MAG: anthranilate synthase component I family protein [Candidatus Neomarinimicrobiota bacterium]